MLKMQVIGNVGQDATIKEANGNKFLSFTVAHSEKWTDKDGQKVERTEWVNVTTDRINLAPHILKGLKVYVDGHPSMNLYNSSQDKKVHYSINLRALQIEFCSFAPKKEEGAAAQATGTPQVPVGGGDDLPF